MFRLGFLISILIALNATGCGKFAAMDSSGSSEVSPLSRKPYGTCDRKSVVTVNLCMEAAGPDYNEPGYLAILESSCESSGGVFSTATCETTQSFGTCVVGWGETNLTYVTYYPPQYTAESAQAACEATAQGMYVESRQ